MERHFSNFLVIAVSLFISTGSFAEQSRHEPLNNNQAMDGQFMVAGGLGDLFGKVKETIENTVHKSDEKSSDTQNESVPVGNPDETVSSRRQQDLTTGEIKEIQQLLTEKGFDPGPIDGKPGSKTNLAIQEYQQRNGLVVDGNTSEALLSHLRNNDTNNSSSNVASSESRQPEKIITLQNSKVDCMQFANEISSLKKGDIAILEKFGPVIVIRDYERRGAGAGATNVNLKEKNSSIRITLLQKSAIERNCSDKKRLSKQGYYRVTNWEVKEIIRKGDTNYQNILTSNNLDRFTPIEPREIMNAKRGDIILLGQDTYSDYACEVSEAFNLDEMVLHYGGGDGRGGKIYFNPDKNELDTNVVRIYKPTDPQFKDAQWKMKKNRCIAKKISTKKRPLASQAPITSSFPKDSSELAKQLRTHLSGKRIDYKTTVQSPQSSMDITAYVCGNGEFLLKNNAVSKSTSVGGPSILTGKWDVYTRGQNSYLYVLYASGQSDQYEVKINGNNTYFNGEKVSVSSNNTFCQ